MLKALLKIFVSNDPAPSRGRYDPIFEHKAEESLDPSTRRYPAFVKGIDYQDPFMMMLSQSKLIQEIKQILRLNHKEFETLVMPCIENYANFVNMLPASEAHHHRGQGGLFRHGLEVGKWACKFADNHQFCRGETPESRRSNEPRWQLASFLAGLIHDIGKPLSDVVVIDKNGNIEWDPYAGSLTDWLVSNELSSFYFRWSKNRHGKHEKLTAMFIPLIIPNITSSYLNRSQIYSAFADAVVGTTLEQPLAQIVMKADQESVRRDLLEQNLSPEDYSRAVPVEKFIFDALRMYVDGHESNVPGALVWCNEESVYINWRSIVPALMIHFAKEKIPGIPRDPDILADILLERNFAVPFLNSGENTVQRYWRVYPEPINGIPITCLRFDRVELIFRSVVPSPVVVSLQPPPKPVDPESEQSVSQPTQLNPTDSVLSSPAVEAQTTSVKEKPGTAASPIPTSPAGSNRPHYSDFDQVPWDEQDNSCAAFYEYSNTSTAELTTTAPKNDIQDISPKTHDADIGPPTGADTASTVVDLGSTPGIAVLKRAVELYSKNRSGLKEYRPNFWVIEHPAMTSLLGDNPSAVLGALKSEDMVQPDPVTSQAVTSLDGVKCIVLSSKAMAIVNRLIDDQKAPSPQKVVSDTDTIRSLHEQVCTGFGSIVGDGLTKEDGRILFSKEITNNNLKAIGYSSNASRMVILERVPGYVGEIFEGTVKYYQFKVD